MSFNGLNNRAIVRNPREADRAWLERVERHRQTTLGQKLNSNVVMISTHEGKTDDIKTGRPPVMKREVREAWAQAREEIGIDKLFR